MILLDLMKSSEVRIAGDWSNYVPVVISKWTRLTCFIKWLFSIPNIFWGRWHIYWFCFIDFFFTLSNILQHAFVFHICFLLFREHNTYCFNDGWWICHFLLSDGPSVVKLRLQGKTLSAGKSHQIKCEAIGAKPQATITWWVGGKQVLHKRSLSRRKKMYKLIVLYYIPRFFF